MKNIFLKFPIIDLGKYVLREMSENDAANFLFYMKDEKFSTFVSERYVPKNLSEAEREIKYWSDLFKTYQGVYWGIALKSTDMLIGSCGFNNWFYTDYRVEISYDLSRKFWNQGIMTQAIKAICDFAFCSMQVNRVQASVIKENIASIKLLEKLGFQREGMMREYAYLRGAKCDSYLYSLLSKDAFNF